MNKYQEALDRIKNKVAIIDGEKMKIGLAYCNTLPILQELVDKETPKKVKIKEFDNGEYGAYCPSCNSGMPFHWKMKYCPSCGQKLDWSDENDN